MKIKKDKTKLVFDRAYDKAAKMKPGDKNPLSPYENKILLSFINKDKKRIRGRWTKLSYPDGNIWIR